MASQTKKPIDLAARVANRRSARTSPATDGAWRRETFCPPRSEAREKAREWFDRYPKAAYMTEIESWRELSDDRFRLCSTAASCARGSASSQLDATTACKIAERQNVRSAKCRF